MIAPADSDSDLDGLIADAADDFHARRDRGENPDPEEYAARHPAAADRLRRVLGMLRRVTIDPPADRPVPEVLGDFGHGPTVTADLHRRPSCRPGCQLTACRRDLRVLLGPCRATRAAAPTLLAPSQPGRPAEHRQINEITSRTP